jgi:CRP-like cAMP-binding protein
VIFQKGDEGTKFYIITSGQLRVEDLDIHTVKRINDYDTFGEGSLLTGEPRNATIIAETPVNLITIDKESFLHLIQDTDLENKLLALVKHRTEQTWDTLCDSEIFDNTTSFQKTAFEAMLKPYAVKKGYTLIQRGKPFDRVYLVRTGKVRRISKGEEIRILERGDLVGDITQIKFDKPATSTFITETSCDLYYVTRTEMVEYIETYPNVYMTLIYNEH